MTIPFRPLSYFRVFLCSACVIGFWNQSVQAQTETFYKNKTIRVIVGFTPGGFYDRWARLVARHMPRYIPGNPEMIVQNMPGASSVIAANYVYNVAKGDGLTILAPINSLYLDQIVERKDSRPRPHRSRGPRQTARDPPRTSRRSENFIECRFVERSHRRPSLAACQR